MKQYCQNVAIVVSALTVFGLLAVPESEVLAYSLTGKSWATTSATYQVNPNFSDPEAGSAAEQIAAIRSGADEWKLSGEGNFAFAYGGTTNLSTVALDGTNAVYYAGTDGGGALAVCWYWSSGSTLMAFDIEFYDRDGGFDFVWARNPTFSQFDIEGVACHEFGHALGLDHSAVAGATMYPSVAPGNTANRSIDPDDIAGYQSLYGSGSPATPAPATVTPASGWIDGGYQVTIDGSMFPSTGLTVRFGSVEATSITRVDSTRIKCDVPAGVDTEAVDVTVAATNSGVLPGAFNYLTMRNNSAPAPGTWQLLEVKVPAAPNVFFQGALSLGNSGIPCSSFGDPSDGRVIPLSVDWLLEYSVGFPGNAISGNIQGFTDGSGSRMWSVFLSDLPQLSGMTFYACYVTGDMGGSPSGISYIGNVVPITIP